ncbi:hypothetical protein [Leifsonia sp. Leaf264]|uniref:hypothetical protein n=1 Tax=Leifsonia sp. Leaf264 TaxID=1736314 RepID=UPI0006F6BC4B|nr:hypothetical protein [Leifsonia sp. Leaf264]KQP01882.1 hypothetical protein ASF30_04820 [Leifsonia sp. Leaf264]
MFDITLDYVQDENQRARNDAVDRIVEGFPQLSARYLEKMQRTQELPANTSTRRCQRSSSPISVKKPRPFSQVAVPPAD